MVGPDLSRAVVTFITTVPRNHQSPESFVYMEQQVNTALGQMRSLFFQVDIILCCVRVWLQRGKNVTVLNKEGQFVRTDCGGMQAAPTENIR